jgi:glycosyltransferase involved in cell wall biosynthesis
VLAQSPRPDEVIVVDDGSSDATADVARSFGPPVRCVVQAASGIGAAVNRGVREASGGLLAFLDADDLWTLEKLGLQLAVLGEHPALDAVFGHAQNFRADGTVEARMSGLIRGTMVVRREAFDRVGPFADWRLGEFIDWYARAVDLGLATLTLPDVVLLRRVHDANTGVTRRDERDEYTRVLKSVLDRRRAEPS